MTQSDLGQYLSTKRDTFLLGQVEQWSMLQKRPPRRTDVLHPSEITKSDWCIRESWWLLRGAAKKPEVIGFRLANIFQTGHDIHHKWQSWLRDMDVLLGAWRCDEHGAWWGRRSECPPECRVVYLEVPVVDPDYRIAGHADGWIRQDNKPDALLEIKSIGTGTIRVGGGRIVDGGLEKSFGLITRPFAGHVRQATLYLWVLKKMYMVGLTEEQPPDQILFIYECKADQNAKEFTVAYDEDWVSGTREKLDLLFAEDVMASTSVPPDCTGGPKCGCKVYG